VGSPDRQLRKSNDLKPLKPPNHQRRRCRVRLSPLLSPLLELVESTRSQGEELFGESADNITAVVVACEVTLPS